MTAATSSLRPTPRFPTALLLAGLLVLFAVILYGFHAEKHRSADTIRRCIERNGPSEIWQDVNRPQIEYWLCQLPNGKTGWMILQKWNSLLQKCTHKECTSYIPKQGNYARIVNYLREIAYRVK